MCILPGLVRLYLGFREGLDVDDEEVVGVVSGCEISNQHYSSKLSLQPLNACLKALLSHVK